MPVAPLSEDTRPGLALLIDSYGERMEATVSAWAANILAQDVAVSSVCVWGDWVRGRCVFVCVCGWGGYWGMVVRGAAKCSVPLQACGQRPPPPPGCT